MKYLTEFRNGEVAQRMAREIHAVTTRPWKIMEVCGGQTHSIIKNGIDQMLPAGIEMVHGPGCPVCVTPLSLIDKALAIASQPGVIFCSFGDMLRVPGTEGDLFQVKGRGGDVLRGAIKPAECPAFGKQCTPRHPLGATMVSSEGACAAYYNYGRFLSAEELKAANSTQ